MLLQIITECSTEAGNSAVDAIVEAVKKIAKAKNIYTAMFVFYHVALPMLESLEEKPEFEEACDTAVREAVYTKARRYWCHYTIILSVTSSHRVPCKLSKKMITYIIQ